MSIFLKRISLMLLLMVLVGGCAKKLPPQVSEGKAFSDQPYVVQGNMQYNVEEYRFGKNIGDNPPEGEQLYASIKIKAQNIGTVEEKPNPEDFQFKAGGKTFPLFKISPKKIIEAPLKPGKTTKSWVIFKIPQKPEGAKEFLIKQAKIILE